MGISPVEAAITFRERTRGLTPPISARILIVDDDPNIREVIGFALESSGFATQFADNGLAALEQLETQPCDLVVLDVGLPELDGFEACRQIRKDSAVPVLFLTAREDEIDRIVGLEIGGDDYVTKPFSPRELVARIKAILKRTKPTPGKSDTVFRQGDLELHSDQHSCRVSGTEVALTASEFQLLKTLMTRPTSLFSRTQLMDAVYGSNIHVSERTIDSHIRNVRGKLAQAGCLNSIETIHGVGLRMGNCRTS